MLSSQSTDNVSAVLVSFAERDGFEWLEPSLPGDSEVGVDADMEDNVEGPSDIVPPRPAHLRLRLSRSALASVAAALQDL